MLEPAQVVAGYTPHHYALNSILETRASLAGGREFLVFGESSWSYCETTECVARVAGAQHSHGVKADQRVAVMSLNHPSTVFILFALARLGAIMVPINPEFRADETRYVLGRAEVSGVVCSPAALGTVRAAAIVANASP